MDVDVDGDGNFLVLMESGKSTLDWMDCGRHDINFCTVGLELDGRIVAMSPAIYGSGAVVFGGNSDNEEELLFLLLI